LPWRLVMLSGDWIPTDLPGRVHALAPQATLYSLGGATEASIWSIDYPITQVDPDWRTRLRFAHACHYLAESACRLSDRRHRAYGEVSGWDACVLLSTGLLLLGIRQLDELLDGSGPGLPSDP